MCKSPSQALSRSGMVKEQRYCMLTPTEHAILQKAHEAPTWQIVRVKQQGVLWMHTVCMDGLLFHHVLQELRIVRVQWSG